MWGTEISTPPSPLLYPLPTSSTIPMFSGPRKLLETPSGNKSGQALTYLVGEGSLLQLGANGALIELESKN